MLFQAPPLTEREKEVVDEIEAIRRELDLPRLQEWPGLPWRAINARLLGMSTGGVGVDAMSEDGVEMENDEETSHESSSALGYRTALTFALHLADAAHFTYDEGVFRALHFMIAGDEPDQTPARWRRGAIWVKRQPSGETLYTAPAPKMIPVLMAELIASLNQASDDPPIVRAAMAHFNIAAIHPFNEGNGRMSRATHTLVMARAGVTEPPFASIDEYLSVKQEEYNQALRAVHDGSWQPERDTRPWIRFCLNAHYYQATMLARRSKEYDRLWDAIEGEIARHGIPDRATFAVAQAATGDGLASDEYESAASVSSDEARGDLKALVDAGVLVECKSNGASSYVASGRIKEIWTRTRDAGQSNMEPFSISAS